MRAELEALLNANPFVPFSIVVASGDRFSIENPNALTLADAVLYIMDFGSDRHTIVRANQVCHVEVDG